MILKESARFFAVTTITAMIIALHYCTCSVSAGDNYHVNGESREFLSKGPRLPSNSARHSDDDDYFEEPYDSTESVILNDGIHRDSNRPATDNSNDLLIPAPGQSSLVVVFDGTTSMFDDLQQLKMAAAGIIKQVQSRATNPIYNYILVPFRDPSESQHGN